MGLVPANKAAIQPPVCSFHGLSGVLFFDGVGRALIECHNNVGANGPLNIHYGFGRKKVRTSVDVGLKFDTLLADFTAIFKTVDLKATAIRKHGPCPCAERMKPSGLLEHLGSGAQVEVVRVAQHNVGTGI
jgi:hypothetical protein